MRQSRKLLLLTLTAVMALSFAFASTASAKKVKRVDNFIILLDHSGSMAMKYSDSKVKKINMAVNNIQAMDKAVPAELGYNSGMFAFAPFAELTAPGAYAPNALTQSVDGLETEYEIFNRRTPLGGGVADIDPTIGSMSGKTALIILTDGESNTGADPLAAAQALHDQYGDNLCVHIISYADTAAGEQTIKQMRSIFPCSVAATSESLMEAGAMDAYASKVFYEEVADAQAPAPAPVVTPAAPEVVSFNLNFGFDKYEILDDMVPVLEQAKMILEETPSATFVVAGYTDSTGADTYNQGLSERRANSVVEWLTKNGVSASRLEAVGYGETNPKFDNGTKEGRKLNRRVEIRTK
ncbi:OmpA family protein [Pseudodesulfovibrio sediminis]|uniref:Membrane protein n=1 Tax=Pseudodesulfovibrio sediminis TaxID=2810563 RepID=A0ABM7P6E7_9BACT|nr:OmpA family protein [Pseudodesulfovibrio sediminis]BCS88494.1 membrane protein [Pseudodesulfovibrio sediminis]